MIGPLYIINLSVQCQCVQSEIWNLKNKSNKDQGKHLNHVKRVFLLDFVPKGKKYSNISIEHVWHWQNNFLFLLYIYLKFWLNLRIFCRGGRWVPRSPGSRMDCFYRCMSRTAPKQNTSKHWKKFVFANFVLFFSASKLIYSWFPFEL